MRVYKYRSGGKETLKRDLRSLVNSHIFAAPIESLNDLSEATVIVDGKSFEIGRALSFIPNFDYNDNVREAESRFINVLIGFVEKSKTFGIYSLSRCATDELLWAHYGDSHRGFCLEYDIDLLRDYKLQNEWLVNVDYSEQVPVITASDLYSKDAIKEVVAQKLLGTKSRRWEYEQETRLITGKTDLYEYDFRALKGIYFGHRSTNRLRRLIMRLMRGRGIAYFEIRPVNGTYKLEPCTITDPYIDAPRYRTRMAPVEDGVPLIDDKLRPYERLVRKAIEMARREPYVERVYDVYICGDKGTPENPVFFVNYERSDGVPRNIYYSAADIECSGT